MPKKNILKIQQQKNNFQLFKGLVFFLKYSTAKLSFYYSKTGDKLSQTYKPKKYIKKKKNSLLSYGTNL